MLRKEIELQKKESQCFLNNSENWVAFLKAVTWLRYVTELGDGNLGRKSALSC